MWHTAPHQAEEKGTGREAALGGSLAQGFRARAYGGECPHEQWQLQRASKGGGAWLGTGGSAYGVGRDASQHFGSEPITHTFGGWVAVVVKRLEEHQAQWEICFKCLIAREERCKSGKAKSGMNSVVLEISV